MEVARYPDIGPYSERHDSPIGAADINFITTPFDTPASPSPSRPPLSQRKKSLTHNILEKLPLPTRRKSTFNDDDNARKQSISSPVAGSGRKMSVDDSSSEEHSRKTSIVDRLLRRRSSDKSTSAHVCGVEHCICEAAEEAGLSHQQERRKSELPALVKRSKPAALVGTEEGDGVGLMRVRRHGDW